MLLFFSPFSTEYCSDNNSPNNDQIVTKSMRGQFDQDSEEQTLFSPSKTIQVDTLPSLDMECNLAMATTKRQNQKRKNTNEKFKVPRKTKKIKSEVLGD
jgi:hypothetical protein